MTGWPLDLLLQGIDALCQADPRSRSKAEDGRRLTLIDPTRDWGWRVVNIGIYRAKAAGLNQVASGKNAEKVRRYKERHRQTPSDTSGHQKTPETPHSYSDSNTDSNKEKRGDGERAARAPTARRLPDDFSLTEQRRAIARAERADADREFAKFTDHWRAASGANARKHDWDAAWRNWCRKSQDMRPNGRGSPADEPKLTWRPPPDEDEKNARR
jgi:hypothetical protein